MPSSILGMEAAVGIKKVFVYCPDGLVTLTVFPRSGFICLFSEAHPISGLADVCTHAVVSQLPKSVAFAVALVKSSANATVRSVGFVVAFVSYSESSESYLAEQKQILQRDYAFRR